MSLDSLGGLDGVINMSTPNEKLSEKHDERIRQAQVQLKKIQKDEKKAKGDNQRLFLILSRFLQDEYYQDLIPDISALLSISFSSRGIIALLALLYPDATYYVTHSLSKSDKMSLLLNLSRSPDQIDFDEKNVSSDIKNWITEWIALMQEFLVHEDASVLLIKKNVTLLNGEHSILIQRIFARFLVFFFKMRNINMSESASREFAGFIKKNVSNFLSKYLETNSRVIHDLIEDIQITDDDLFHS